MDIRVQQRIDKAAKIAVCSVPFGGAKMPLVESTALDAESGKRPLVYFLAEAMFGNVWKHDTARDGQ